MAHFTEASLEIILAFNFQVKKQDIKSFGFSSEVKNCYLQFAKTSGLPSASKERSSRLGSNGCPRS
jgi:hypothetical protein